MTMTIAEVDDVQLTTVSWGAIFAGAVAACAVALMMLALGVGLGFSVISPWADQGVSASTFGIAAGIYLIVVSMIASAIGGYLTGRLRRRWLGTHSDEAFFRDSAHGFVTWALALLISATVLGTATTQLLSGVAAGIPAAGAATASAATPADLYVDQLLRPAPAAATPATPAPAASPANPATGQDLAATRADFGRILLGGMARNGEVSEIDRRYLAQAIAARTGLSEGEAERRVTEIVNRAKAAADAARSAVAQFSLWLVASMLAGALSAGLAATEGGMLRDSRWYEPGWRWGMRG
jgi:hypothetical protein